MSKIIAKYDVRGIQNYIYKTAKMADAIGASSIVENIISDALKFAVESCTESGITAEMDWLLPDGSGPLPYKEADVDVQVLFIGGGNAYVCFQNEDICNTVNKYMSKYVLDKTYSLQLAIATVPKTDNYATDYANVTRKMETVKSRMNESHPLGALPVVAVEVKTGLPISTASSVYDEKFSDLSRETLQKREQEAKVRKNMAKNKKLLDSYVAEKGIDSTIGIVHIDGNNMGLRIRELIEDKEIYEEAVNKIRQISFQIDNSYKKAFLKMQDKFNGIDEKEEVVLKILTAGDDITYACRGKYALASVEYFTELITQETMTNNASDLDQYGFSVCAGIAYIGSHFPFSIGYSVAESCCDSAKEAAKKTENMYEIGRDQSGKAKYKVGNWVDFQICKNVQTMNFEQTREKEYITATGEQLMLRPYEIAMTGKEARADELHRISSLKSNIDSFVKDVQNGKKFPRSFLKKIRNIYGEGVDVTKSFAVFLESRDWKMPDGTYDMYTKDGKQALWYDALEMLELYVDLEESNKEAE